MNQFWLEKLALGASWALLFGRGLLLAVMVLLVLMRSAVTVVRIDGKSMDPTLHDGQWVLVNELASHFGTWREGDVAILRFPGDPIHTLYVKRIIGLPGDHLELVEGRVKRNGVLLTEPYLDAQSRTDTGVYSLPELVPQGEYIVLGDNREISNDSRFFGTVPEHDLIGKVTLFTQ